MHVLFVTGEYPPMPGGVGAYTAELGRALQAQGVAVSVLTHADAQPAPAVEKSANYPQSFPQFSQWSWGELGKTLDLYRSLGADWLHVQYQTAAFGMHPAINLAPWFWRRSGLRVAWTYHDLLVPYLFPKAGARLRRAITHLPARAAQRVIVTNEADRQALAAAGLRAERIPIGSNIRGISLSPATRSARRAARGYSASTLLLGYFGFLNRSKGGITLVETLHRLVRAGIDARLLMVGERVGASDPTNHRYLQEVEARISALGLTERVRWTGHQPAEAVAADLNAVDVLLMPYEDGISLRRGTLMAGLANGCAIVSTTPPQPLPELQHERDLLLVPPADAAACAAAALRLWQNPALAQRLRANARASSEQFSWSAIAAAHRRLYATQPAER